jgi:hypothetical protein
LVTNLEGYVTISIASPCFCFFATLAIASLLALRSNSLLAAFGRQQGMQEAKQLAKLGRQAEGLHSKNKARRGDKTDN